MHYQRLRQFGSLERTKDLAYDPAERFWRQVRKTPTCWLWTGSTFKGYGMMYLWRSGRSSSIRAHRFSYELLVGLIPDGLQLDHLCRIRHCVNPAHLEPVTCAENIRRGVEARRASTTLAKLKTGESRFA